MSTTQHTDKSNDLKSAEIAMQRAAKKAKELARKNGTAIVTMENGRIRKEHP